MFIKKRTASALSCSSSLCICNAAQTKFCFVRTFALRWKSNSPFPAERLLISSRLHKMAFYLFEKNVYLTCFLIFTAGGFVILSLSANGLIVINASEWISPSAEGDQMAPPFGNLPPLKRWTNTNLQSTYRQILG